MGPIRSAEAPSQSADHICLGDWDIRAVEPNCVGCLTPHGFPKVGALTRGFKQDDVGDTCMSLNNVDSYGENVIHLIF